MRRATAFEPVAPDHTGQTALYSVPAQDARPKIGIRQSLMCPSPLNKALCRQGLEAVPYASTCVNHPCETMMCTTTPPCSPCTSDNDTIGTLCLNGCDGPQQCPIGATSPAAFACRVDADCSSFCVRGCCAECRTRDDCDNPLDQNCVNRVCVTRSGSPIILDVAGNGFSLTDAAHGVDFDFYGDGKKIRIPGTTPNSDHACSV